MAQWIRRWVSQNRRRFTEDGFDLDLCYVTDRIIAMGFPGEGPQGLLRNPMSETVKLLQMRHAGHYKVYNLCKELTYEPEKVEGLYAHFPFEDHQTPPLSLVKLFCEDAEQYLSEDPDNVIVVHCKAGKGRTGIMVCSYLVYKRLCCSAEEAMSLFGEKRTVNNKGVTIPSQRRYIEYFYRVWKDGLHLPQPKALRLMSLRVSGLPKAVTQKLLVKVSVRDPADNEMRPVGVIWEPPSLKRGLGCKASCLHPDVGSSTCADSYQVFSHGEDFQVDFECEAGQGDLWTVEGDLKLQFFEGSATNGRSLFYAWVNTAFVSDRVVLERPELDKVRSWIPDDVQLEVQFSTNVEGSVASREPTNDWIESEPEELVNGDDGGASFSPKHFDWQMESWCLATRPDSPQEAAQVELVTFGKRSQPKREAFSIDHPTGHARPHRRLTSARHLLVRDCRLALPETRSA
ncbi:unnamed protein product [Ostreobium quekettii]|uniref:Phosphatidylinositol-3,4,5-trisphosphate 3-phosphatase n=1 Tax=Ostreobium quekettii TaxID=121088 RepID=A0A8S1J627_9CHLO|nr:unnamed protein product [Ostreobium quekettii]